MNPLILIMGIVIVLVGVWLIVRRPARARTVVPLGVLCVVLGVLVAFGAYWTAFEIQGGSTGPVALSPSPES